MTDKRFKASTINPGLYFNEIAEHYHRLRPGYPEQLVNDILQFAGLSSSGRILEIGCGSGHATLAFAKRNFAMVCLEPGSKLSSLARQDLAPFKQVKILDESFESWPVEAEGFDLIISANAIQWVDRRIRYTKAASVVGIGGTIALFRNQLIDDGSALIAAIHAAASTTLLKPEPRLWPDESKLRKAPQFGSVERFRYEWSQEYEAATFVELLGTRHLSRSLSAEERESIFTKVRNAIERHGGKIRASYVSQLTMARRIDKRSWWRGLIGR